MKHILIVGAGPAGLTTAYQLLKAKEAYHVILVEKEECVGGISKTIFYKGNRMDLGGHRFFTKSKEIKDLWLELLAEQGVPISEELEPLQRKKYSGTADPNQDENVMLIRRRVSRIFFQNHFFDYPVSLSWKTIQNLGLMQTAKCGIGYLKALLWKKKEDSLENFYINRFGKPLYELFFKDYTAKLWGVEPKELGADWGAQRVKKLSLLKAVTEPIKKKINKNHVVKETSLIEEFYYPKFGPGQLWEQMASEIRKMGGELHLGTSCKKIFSEKGKITVVTVETSCGKLETWNIDALVSSMPVKELVEQMQPNAPKHIQKIAHNLPYRDFITVGVLVDELKIQNQTEFPTYAERVPDCWIYIQDRNVKMGRMQIFNNWSPYMVQDSKRFMWISLEYFCSEGDELWLMEKEKFITFALNELEKIGIIEKEHVVDCTLHKVKKAYPAYYGSYSEFGQVQQYLDEFENLFCAGRNGQHRYNNMDHSMLTGIFAAEAIQGLCEKSCLWNVNTEKDYHETHKINEHES